MRAGFKICTGCRESKSRNDFSINNSNKDGIHHYCRDCCRVQMAERRKRDPRMIQRHNLKANYNMTLEEWDKMLAEQNGRCGICYKIMEPPCVDHNHKTGQVRGMLCHHCNRGIGFLGDNPTTIKRAVEYLARIY